MSLENDLHTCSSQSDEAAVLFDITMLPFNIAASHENLVLLNIMSHFCLILDVLLVVVLPKVAKQTVSILGQVAKGQPINREK